MLDLLEEFRALVGALADVWAGRERVAWAHGTLPVVSREGLIAMKRLRGSGQDLVAAAANEVVALIEVGSRRVGAGGLH